MSEEAIDTNNDIHKKKGALKRILKILLIIGVVFIVLITVLASLGGNSDEVKGMIEDILSESTGYNVRIGKMNNASLFPDLGFDFENIGLFETKDIDEEGNLFFAAKPVATINKAKIYFGFWDVTLGTGKIKDLLIEDAYAAPGIYWKEALSLKSLFIEDIEEGKARLQGQGSIGAHPVSLSMDLAVKGIGASKKYEFSGTRHLAFKLGEISLSGVQNNTDNLLIRDFALSFKDQDVATGELGISKSDNGLRLKGNFEILEHKTYLQPDIFVLYDGKRTALKGKIKNAAFHIEDFSSKSPLGQVLSAFNAVVAGSGSAKEEDSEPPPSLHDMLGGVDLNLDLDIQKIYIGEAVLAAFKGELTLKNGNLKLRTKKAQISKGRLDLSFTLDARKEKEEAQLSIDMALHDLDYGALQEGFLGRSEVNGTLDAALNLSGQGIAISDLLNALEGNATLVSGEGQFASGKFNLWGGGLIGALMPDFDSEAETLKLNCAIMDFGIEHGIAKAETLFIDGAHVTIAGEGAYDIAQDYLDLKLSPKSKGISLGDVSTPVHIRGTLMAPSIAPDMFDIGARIGGLLLGVINPAFLAFTLTDLGVGEDHPCAIFMGEATPKEEPIQEEKPEFNE